MSLRSVSKVGSEPPGYCSNCREIYNSFKPVATHRVKTDGILEKSIKKENIEPLQGDIENMIWQGVYTIGLDVNRYILEHRRNNDTIIDLRRRIIRSKALDHLIYEELAESPEVVPLAEQQS
jgi:FKBP-type peptidyl-prolyl cis-trans isomerase (trigger factor)